MTREDPLARFKELAWRLLDEWDSDCGYRFTNRADIEALLAEAERLVATERRLMDLLAEPHYYGRPLAAPDWPGEVIVKADWYRRLRALRSDTPDQREGSRE